MEHDYKRYEPVRSRRESRQQYIEEDPRMTKSNHAGDGFYFRPRRENLDWRTLSHIDIDSLMDNVDIDTLETITKNLTFSKIEAKDLRYFSEENFAHMFRLSQLVIEYLLYVQKFLVEKRESIEADIESILGRLDACRESLQQKESQNHQLRGDVKRLKRTIFAYQIVFGADPDKAKTMLATMRAGGSAPVHQQTENNAAPPPSHRNSAPLGEMISDIKHMRDDIELIQTRMRGEQTVLEVIERKKDELNMQHERRLREMKAEFEKLLDSAKNVLPIEETRQSRSSTTAPKQGADKTDEVLKRTETSLRQRDSQLLQYIDNKMEKTQEHWSNVSVESRHEMTQLRKLIHSTLNGIRVSAQRVSVSQTKEDIVQTEPVQTMKKIPPDSESDSDSEPSNTEPVVRPISVLESDTSSELAHTESDTDSKPPTSTETTKTSIEKANLAKRQSVHVRPVLTEDNFDVEIEKRTDARQILEEFVPGQQFVPDSARAHAKTKLPHESDVFEVKRRMVKREFTSELKAKGIEPSSVGLSKKEMNIKMRQLKQQQADDPELRHMTEKLRELVNGIANHHHIGSSGYSAPMSYLQRSKAETTTTNSQLLQKPIVANKNTISSPSSTSKLQQKRDSRKTGRALAQDSKRSQPEKKQSATQIEVLNRVEDFGKTDNAEEQELHEKQEHQASQKSDAVQEFHIDQSLASQPEDALSSSSSSSSSTSSSTSSSPTATGLQSTVTGSTEMEDLSTLGSYDGTNITTKTEIVEQQPVQHKEEEVSNMPTSTIPKDPKIVDGPSGFSLSELDKEIDELDVPGARTLTKEPSEVSGVLQRHENHTQKRMEQSQFDQLIGSIKNHKPQRDITLDDDLTSIVSLASRKGTPRSSPDNNKQKSTVPIASSRGRTSLLQNKSFDFEDFDYDDFSLGDEH